MYDISELCKRCVWRQQCGQEEPCSHFEPLDMEGWLEKERSEDLKQRHKITTTHVIEQGNYIVGE